MPLQQIDNNVQITIFPPGHVETYSLDLSGRASYVNTTRFHKIGEPPAYKTLVNPVGGWDFALCFWLFVFVIYIL